MGKITKKMKFLLAFILALLAIQVLA